MIKNLSDSIDRAVRILLLMLASVETVVVVASVVARYGFNSSFSWSDEVARALLTWIVFLGASSAIKGHDMIGMTALRDALPNGAIRAFRIIGILLTMCFFLITAYAMWRLMGRTWQQSLPVSQGPLWPVYAAIPIGSLLAIVHLASHLVDQISGSGPLQESFDAT